MRSTSNRGSAPAHRACTRTSDASDRNLTSTSSGPRSSTSTRQPSAGEADTRAARDPVQETPIRPPVPVQVRVTVAGRGSEDGVGAGVARRVDLGAGGFGEAAEVPGPAVVASGEGRGAGRVVAAEGDAEGRAVPDADGRAGEGPGLAVRTGPTTGVSATGPWLPTT